MFGNHFKIGLYSLVQIMLSEMADIEAKLLIMRIWSEGGIFTPTGSSLFKGIVWDGRDDFGDRIGKGVYIYKITVKSTLTNHQTEKFEKLVIL